MYAFSNRESRSLSSKWYATVCSVLLTLDCLSAKCLHWLEACVLFSSFICLIRVFPCARLSLAFVRSCHPTLSQCEAQKTAKHRCLLTIVQCFCTGHKNPVKYLDVADGRWGLIPLFCPFRGVCVPVACNCLFSLTIFIKILPFLPHVTNKTLRYSCKPDSCVFLRSAIEAEDRGWRHKYLKHILKVFVVVVVSCFEESSHRFATVTSNSECFHAIDVRLSWAE